MDNINVLEELGLGEVSRKTHIEVKFLEYMLNKDFGKLHRTNTLGFVKILQREYDIDLSEWVDEFEIFCIENKTKDDKTYSNALFGSDKKESRGFGKFLLFLLLLCLLAGAFYVLNNLGYIKMLQDKFTQNESNNTPYVKANIVDQTQKQLNDLQKKDIEDNVEVEVVVDENETNQLDAMTNLEDNQSNENPTPIIEKDDNKTIITSEIESSDPASFEENNETTKPKQEPTENNLGPQKVFLTPPNRIWVGLINLENKKRRQYLTGKPIEIDLSMPQIIITGHGHFNFEYDNGKVESFNSNGKQYYYVDDGNIKKISKKEFISYNGGKYW
ncbi:MAG: hypothetical protein CR967_04435 [Proteobacteria bacterium]|nr:MAG: hypothetical protein CR967_04435 [Pseudomonadota bacterium]